jgi:hypothetical protein
VYQRGVENKVVDALSRIPDPGGCVQETCLALSSCQLKWLEQVVDSYASNPYAKEVIAKLMVDAEAVPNFTWSQGVLRYKSRIWVGADLTLQTKFISECHSSAIGGHSGVPITYMMVKQLFAWKGLKLAVHDFVKACLVCQQAKPERSKSPRLLQPLDIHAGA